GLFQELAPAAGSPDAPRRGGIGTGVVQFPNPGRDGRSRQARGGGHPADTAPRQLPGFRGRPLPPRPFVEHGGQSLKLAPNPLDDTCVLHAAVMVNCCSCGKGNCSDYSCAGPIRRRIVTTSVTPRL